MTHRADPRTFMVITKFIAGRIHQMRAGKCYLAGHPTWRTPEADTSCPRCGLEPETFEHAILSCPSKQGPRSHHLYGVTGISHEDPIWTSPPLLKRLVTFMSVTSTGFAPMIFPPSTPLSLFPPATCLSPQSSPRGISCFFVGRGFKKNFGFIIFPSRYKSFPVIEN